MGIAATSMHDEVWNPAPTRYHSLTRLARWAVDGMPEPWGEEVMAFLGVAQALVRPDRLRLALAWASSLVSTRGEAWRLALAVLSFHGRFVAMEGLVGVRGPEDLRHKLALNGSEHLETARKARGSILLGFHLGPPPTWVALRAAGYPVAFAGDPDASACTRWPRAAWRPFLRAAPFVSIAGSKPAERLRGLHEALRRVDAGEMLYLTADGPFGREAFRLPVPGGILIVRSGWLAARRHTGAPIFPVLAHRDAGTGRRVITIHPQLPPPGPDLEQDAALCRAVLAPIVNEYVRQHPEQCPWLAVVSPTRPRPPTPARRWAGTGSSDFQRPTAGGPPTRTGV